MRYMVLGCGAIGGTVAAGLVRDGHAVLVCDADAAVVRAINDGGLRIEGPVEQFAVKVPAVLPADLPGQIDGPVLVAVKAHHTGAAAALLAGRLTGDGFAVSLQNGLTAAMLANVLGSGRVVGAAVNFGADAIEPGVILRGNRATLLVGELDGRPSERVARLAADLADARATADVLGYIWTKEAYGATLFATAVSDLPIHAVFADPAYRPLLTAVAAEVLAQAPVRPLPLDGFDPADVPGSLDRMVEFNRQSAKSHSGVYRDLAIRHRPTKAERDPGSAAGRPAPPDQRAGRRDRAGRPDLRAGEPRSACRLRAGRAPGPAGERGRRRDRRARQGRGRAAGRAAGRGQGHCRGCGPAEALRQPGHER